MVERVKGNRFGGLPFNLGGPAVIESPVTMVTAVRILPGDKRDTWLGFRSGGLPPGIYLQAFEVQKYSPAQRVARARTRTSGYAHARERGSL